jgi:small-conductance mechanosensitive channel
MNTKSPRKLLRVSDALKGSTEPTRRLMERPRLRRAMVTGFGAVVLLLVSSRLHARHAHTVTGYVWLYGLPLLFLILGIACVRATATELDDLARWRGGRTAGSTIRMVVSVVGYLITVVATLGMASFPIGRFLVGGAIAGVILGIAAQQSLGNVFAGLVLLAARPFSIGNHIRVRSGALGGEFYGTVMAMSLTYVTMSTVDGVLKVPNSSVLASAVGPYRPQSGATMRASSNTGRPD